MHKCEKSFIILLFINYYLITRLFKSSKIQKWGWFWGIGWVAGHGESADGEEGVVTMGAKGRGEIKVEVRKVTRMVADAHTTDSLGKRYREFGGLGMAAGKVDVLLGLGVWCRQKCGSLACQIAHSGSPPGIPWRE